MVKFDWKATADGKFPPEPDSIKDGWQAENPGMSKMEIVDWWDSHFEIYACRMFGVPGPIPTNLYYIGDEKWMSETGHVYKAVTHWDSYTEEE